MHSKAVEQLLEQGERSGLFATATAQDLMAQLTPDEHLTVDAVAAQMVEKKVLTPYQAEQLLAGRGEECMLAGRYRILDKLGEGGMGAVYKAHDTHLDRDVAVKVLPPRSVNDADAVARFQREARALARLSHPNIIQAYDSGEDRGRPFLVMEYVAGVNLSALLRERGAVPPTLAADLIYQAALGLQHAHEKGLVHRDLKPANLLWSSASTLPGSGSTPSSATPAALGKGIVKILDLGLARFLQDQLGDSQLTREGAGIGTPDYMAPEQFRDALHADARTDIYGLGCTLYQLIGGTVPFPGSSFSEKAQAHAKKEPIPLEERCPEVPAGLAFVVSKMMAKHPAERFQTAAEVVEALAPYIAGSSQSAVHLRQTGRWPPGQVPWPMPGRSKGMMLAAGAVALVAVCLCVLVFAWPGLFGLGPTPTDETKPPDDLPVAGGPGPARKDANGQSDPGPKKPITIENGLTVAKDGRGQFTSINQALQKVKPGQTVRVLDRARYAEDLVLNPAGAFEGVVLEAADQATIVVSKPIAITSTLRLQLVGFRFESTSDVPHFIQVVGRCAGLKLQGLEFQCRGRRPPSGGVTVEGTALEDSDEPIVIANCRVHGGYEGIRVMGMRLDYKTPWRCRRVIIRDNLLVETERAVIVYGSAQQVHVVGNRIAKAGWVGVQIENLLSGAEDLLVANNTFIDCGSAFRVWNDDVSGKNVQVRGNLVLNCSNADMLNADSGGNPQRDRGPGDHKRLHKEWTFSHNWREVSDPDAGALAPYRIPPAGDDVQRPSIAGVVRLPEDANFLRPGKTSPLASGGTGGDLPAYVGALPPEGVEPWDWHWTWEALAERRLTVSKDPKKGGRFRTIAAALKAAKPRTTIRVLDAEKYAEPLVIDDTKSHEGLTLEAPHKATLVLAEDAPQSIAVHGVARVRVSGFRFETAQLATRQGGLVCFVMVGAGCPGLVLEGLEMRSSGRPAGIVLFGSVLPADAEPIVVRKCHIQVNAEGIALSGNPETPVSRVLVLENHVRGSRGIFIERTVHDVVVAANVVSNADQAGIHIENPLAGMRHVLVANNTVVNNSVGVRIWRDGTEDMFEDAQVEFRGNILMTSRFGDLLYFRRKPGAMQGELRNGQIVQQRWRFGHNWRDRAGIDEARVFPLAKDDRKLEPSWLLSRIATDPDFLRPKPDSPLATGGAGSELPPYAGAVPPAGVEAWDWHTTWKARARKSP